jgi:hypothetical protein
MGVGGDNVEESNAPKVPLKDDVPEDAYCRACKDSKLDDCTKCNKKITVVEEPTKRT